MEYIGCFLVGGNDGFEYCVMGVEVLWGILFCDGGVMVRSEG